MKKCNWKFKIPRFKIGQRINVKTGDTYEIDMICITKDGIKYGGIWYRYEELGYVDRSYRALRNCSRWALQEYELIQFRRKNSETN